VKQIYLQLHNTCDMTLIQAVCKESPRNTKVIVHNKTARVMANGV